MDNGLIPYRYAKALYKFALEQNRTKEVYDIAKQVAAVFDSHPDMQKVLSNPFVKESDKSGVLIAAAGKSSDDAYERFVKLIVEHHREAYARLMMLAYCDIYRKANHILQAKITTSAPLEEKLRSRLRKLVEDSFKNSSIEFSESIDKDLIGGFVIDVDSVRMDASVSNELEQLRQTLLRSK